MSVSLFGDGAEEGVGSGDVSTENETPDDGALTQSELIQKAVKAYDNAQSALQSGDWSAYGKHLDELEEILAKLAE